MLKISHSVTLELEKGGQRITIDLEEARQIIKDLAKLVQDGERSRKRAPNIVMHHKDQLEQAQSNHRLSTRTGIHMSETKRKEILEHLSRQLSSKPRTLSNLLKGVSYVPNHLSHIRRMLEGERNVTKKNIRRRTYYMRKS